MIQKRDILKMVRAVHRHGRGGKTHRFIHPAREWVIGLLFALLALVGGMGYAAYTYNAYNTIERTLTVPEVQTVRYQAVQVERALEIFDARQAALAREIANIPAAATSTEAEMSTTTESIAPESVSEAEPAPEVVESTPETSSTDLPLIVQ